MKDHDKKRESIFFPVCFGLLMAIDCIDNTSLLYSGEAWIQVMYLYRNGLYFLLLGAVGLQLLRRGRDLLRQGIRQTDGALELEGAVLMLLLGVASYFGSGDSGMLVFFVTVLAFAGKSPQKLARLYFAIKSIALAATIFCWHIGLLPSLYYQDDTVGYYNTYGFCHRNVLGANLAILCLLWFYLRYRKFNLWDFVGWGAVAVISYRCIYSRTTLVMILLIMLSMYLMRRHETRILCLPHLKTFAGFLLVAIVVFCLLCAIFYSSDVDFWKLINRLLSKRISFAHECIEDYGFSLFGQDIPFISTMEAQSTGEDRLILDNSFLRAILYYGILPALAFFFLYIRALRYSVRRRDGALFTAMILFLLFGLSERYMLDAFYQFPVLLASCGFLFQDKKEQAMPCASEETPPASVSTEEHGSIQKNFAYNVAYQLLLIVLPLITTPYISRVFGAEGVGTYTYTYTVANYFVLFGMLGVKNYGNRSVAAVREDPRARGQIFWQIYGLQLVCALCSFALYVCYVFFFAGEYQQIALIQGLYVLSAALDISWLFFGLEKFKITVTRNIAIRLLGLGCIFLFVNESGDLWKYTLILSLSSLLSQLYLWRYIRQMVPWVAPKWADIIRHLRGELVLFVPIIAVSLYTMMDKIMLEQMSNVTQVGFYENASKVVNIPLSIITALGTVMLPRMSNLAAQGKVEKEHQYILRSMYFAMFLAIAMMFGLVGVAQELIPVFLGDNYSACIQLLQLLALTVPFIAWANVIRTQYLIPNHWDRSYIISVSLGAVVNLAVNLALIPQMAAQGAVIGTICAEAVVCLSQTWMVRRQLELGTYVRNAVPFLLFGGVMLAAVLGLHTVLPSGAVSLVCEVLVGAVVYLLFSGCWFAHKEPLLLRAIFVRIRKELQMRLQYYGRRLIALLLAVLLLCGVEMAYAFINPSLEMSYVNPQYSSEIAEADLISPDVTQTTQTADVLDKTAYLTAEEASTQVRAEMKEREETIVVYVQSTEFTRELLTSIANDALEHTGDPREGDYLRWNYAGWKSSASAWTEDGVYYITITYTYTYFTTKEQEDQLTTALEAVLAQLDVLDASDYRKISTVYDYICSHVTYDYDHVDDEDYTLKYTAYAALMEGTAVCQGYASLLYRMALELNVDCRFIYGTGSSGAHGWNIVCLDGMYYALDSTWDAGEETFDYFLKCEADFGKHTPADEYTTEEFEAAYPMAQESYTITESVHSYAGTFDWEEVTDADGELTGYTASVGQLVCVACGDEQDGREAEVTFETIDATCTEDGSNIWTARAYDDAGTLVLISDTKVEELFALGHDFADGACVRCGATEPLENVKPKIAFVYSQDQTSVKITWKPVNNADGYKIYRALSADADQSEWVLVKTLSAEQAENYTNATTGYLEYRNTGLTVGQTYYYRVRAYSGDLTDPENCDYSEFSDVAFMPAAVVIDSSYSNTTSRVRITWKEVSGATGYQIWRQNEDGSWTIVKTLGDKGTTLTDNQGEITIYSNTGLTAGQKYTYRIRAFTITEDGLKLLGAFSDLCTVAVKPETVTLTGGRAVWTQNAAKLFWSEADGAAGYQIWMAEGEDGTYQIVKSVTDSSASSYTVQHLTAGQTYYFRVRAYVEVDGNKTFGEYSNTVLVRIN